MKTIIIEGDKLDIPETIYSRTKVRFEAYKNDIKTASLTVKIPNHHFKIYVELYLEKWIEDLNRAGCIYGTTVTINESKDTRIRL